MQPLPKYDHIEGLEGRVPVGAVLTVGTKGPSGAPTHNDRFYFKSPTPDASGGRPEHPEFAAWNKADASKRLTVRGHLVHSSREECFEYHLRAQVLPGRPGHPNKAPHCVGDGVRATRLSLVGQEWQSSEIECPNELCEFRQGEKKACRPTARLYFSTRWNDDPKIPSMLVKLTTQSWNSIANILGFFDDLDAQRKALGLEGVSLYGLPFMLSLTRKTKPSAKTAFPVLTITPLADIVEFLSKQRARLIEAAQMPRMIAAGVGMVPESTPEEIALDLATINPGIPTKPAQVADPEPIEDAEIVEIGPPALSRDRLEYIQEQGRRLGLSLSDIEQAWGRDLMTATVNDETEILAAIAKRGRKAR